MNIKKKIFIDSPSFLKSSNGTVCIRDLIKNFELNNLRPIQIYRPGSILSKLIQKLNLPLITSKSIKILKEESRRGDWFIVCDTTPSYIIRIARSCKMRIVWWQLAPYKFLGSNQIPRIGEYSIPFSSYADPDSDHYFYYQPVIEIEWERALEKIKLRKNKKHFRLCIYTGKGRLCELDENIRNLFPNYKIEIITRLSPKLRSDFFNLLINSDGLISFDEMTQTNLEAASLGLPVYLANPLFPEDCIRKFNIDKLKERITKSSKEFVSIIKKENSLFEPFSIDYLQSFNKETLKVFLDIVNEDIQLDPLDRRKILSFEKYTNNLFSKKIIFPYINSGQAPSSLLIRSYTYNLINNRKDSNFENLMLIFDYFGHIFYKLGIIRIIEKLFIRKTQ